MKSPKKINRDQSILEEFISQMLDSEQSDAQRDFFISTEHKEIQAAEAHSQRPASNIPWSSLTHRREVSSDPSAVESVELHPKEALSFKEPSVADERLIKVQSLLSTMPKVENAFEQEDKPQSEKELSNGIEPPSALKSQTDSDVEPGDEVTTDLVECSTSTAKIDELADVTELRDVAKLKTVLGNEFQTLIFNVGKLPLGVPLVKLGGLHAFSQDDLTPIFGTPNWFLGVIPSDEGNIKLVDTARFIMPEKYEATKQHLDYRYAILLDDTRWALACNDVGEAKALSLDDVRWAAKGTRKPWFAGMIVDYMCALIEVDALINLLHDGTKR